MTKNSKIEVLQLMREMGMVPLFYHSDISVAKQVLQACYDAGARLLEFTARGDFAFDVFAELSAYAKENLEGMILGVGSITDAAAASLYMQMGARFVVTPSLREDIVKICNRRRVLCAPGCGSLTEINRAEELGCDVVKLFPASIYGPKFIKAVRGPQPWTCIMPTGGVQTDKESLKSWIDAGSFCVGLGSQLIDSHSVNSGDFKDIEKKVAQTLKTIRELK